MSQRLKDIDYIGVILWIFRAFIILLVVVGIFNKVVRGYGTQYSASDWVDFIGSGLSQGSLYALIALGKDRRALWAAYQYLIMGTIGATFIIIGDGRSNYANPEAGILDDMREKCRRLIWLNPETEMFWYSGDSEMRIYEGLCDEVRPCANLYQLTEFIRELVL